MIGLLRFLAAYISFFELLIRRQPASRVSTCRIISQCPCIWTMPLLESISLAILLALITKASLARLYPSRLRHQKKNALKKFARAHRAQFVDGPPTILLTIKIPAKFAVQHFLAQDIKILDDRPEETVRFLKAVNSYNYPTMMPQVTHIDVEGAPEALLTEGYSLLS